MGEELTHAKLKELVEYNPETGVMMWKTSRSGVRTDHVFGWLEKIGYRCGRLMGKKYYVHRLIWFYMTGLWPAQVVDHKNGNGSDNRWCNLREATLSENSRNRSVLRKNKTGYKGVRQYGKNTWIARIGGLHGVGQKVIGKFSSPEDASKAFEDESRRLYVEFSHTERPTSDDAIYTKNARQK